MKYGKQIMLLYPQPESLKKINIIDKTIKNLADDIEVIQNQSMSADEKWKLLKYKLINYHDIVSKLRKPYVQSEEDLWKDSNKKEQVEENFESDWETEQAKAEIKKHTKKKIKKRAHKENKI